MSDSPIMRDLIAYGGVLRRQGAEDLIAAIIICDDWFRECVAAGRPLHEGADLKMVHEAQEYEDDPSLEELADVFICILGALKKHQWSLGSLALAVARKVRINANRVWVKLPDGTWRHE